MEWKNFECPRYKTKTFCIFKFLGLQNCLLLIKLKFSWHIKKFLAYRRNLQINSINLKVCVIFRHLWRKVYIGILLLAIQLEMYYHMRWKKSNHSVTLKSYSVVSFLPYTYKRHNWGLLYNFSRVWII